ncbi:MAG: hypothetical protein GX491_11635 [Chloroflexi bacterium]|nr:hypothetical protein [Chloroflexota bacterium]
MRKRQTFLLTILKPDSGDSSFCGRVKVISSGKTRTFTTLDELNGLIASEMNDEEMLHAFQSFDELPEEINPEE